jgi:hypothetical protein
VNLLLESHFPKAVTRELERRCPDLKVIHLRDWKGGAFLGAPDADLLAEAARENLTLVTYDLKAIPPLVRRLAEEGSHHAGVILIDNSTIESSDVGGLVAALVALWRTHGMEDWTDRCEFVRRPR